LLLHLPSMSKEQYTTLSQLFRQPPSYQRDRSIGDLYLEVNAYSYAIRSYNKALDATTDLDTQWELMHIIASLHFNIGEPRTAIGLLVMANSIAPDRPESLYKIIDHERVKHPAGCIALLKGLINIPENKNSYPGKIDFIHAHGIDSLVLIVAYYCGINDVGKHLFNIFNRYRSDDEFKIFNNSLANYRFYAKKLEPKKLVDISKTITINDHYSSGKITTLKSSTPSILKTDDGYIVNMRFVNYTLKDNGTFSGDGINYVYNLNVSYLLDKDLQIVRTLFESHPPKDLTTYDRGPQDVRLWRTDTGNIVFTSTIIRNDRKVPWVAVGDYKEEVLQFPIVINHTLNQSVCEKNWVFVKDNTLIYSWHPLIIGKLLHQEARTSSMMADLTECLTIDSPRFFKWFRGSTHGHPFGNNEILFVTHLVYCYNPRVYFHIFITLDATTFAPKRCSYPFPFKGLNVEYCAGLVVDGGDVLLTYSLHDSSSYIAVFDKSYIDGLLWKV
jgi:tetratricopeptide (TPR) repeat protein